MDFKTFCIILLVIYIIYNHSQNKVFIERCRDQKQHQIFIPDQNIHVCVDVDFVNKAQLSEFIAHHISMPVGGMSLYVDNFNNEIHDLVDNFKNLGFNIDYNIKDKDSVTYLTCARDNIHDFTITHLAFMNSNEYMFFDSNEKDMSSLNNNATCLDVLKVPFKLYENKKKGYLLHNTLRSKSENKGNAVISLGDNIENRIRFLGNLTKLYYGGIPLVCESNPSSVKIAAFEDSSGDFFQDETLKEISNTKYSF